MGRPTKCTPELTERVCEALKKGVSIKSAMELAGCDESTYYKWRRRAEEELARVDEDARRSVRKSETPYVQFFKATTRAIAESEEWLVEKVREHVPRDGHLALKVLERRFRGAWTKSEIRELQGKGGGPIQTAGISLDTDDPKELQQMYEELFSGSE